MKIYILFQNYDGEKTVITTSLDKTLLEKKLKEEVTQHIEQYYDANKPKEAARKKELLAALENDSTYWTDGATSGRLSYYIDESDMIDHATAESAPEVTENNCTYDVAFEPMVNVPACVADPEHPTEKEQDAIYEAAAEKLRKMINDDPDFLLENVSILRLYTKDGKEIYKTFFDSRA